MKDEKKYNSSYVVIKAYENLANAIIIQAANDLKEKLKKGESIKEFFKFFNSEYFSVLTNVDGKSLFKRILKEYKS